MSNEGSTIRIPQFNGKNFGLWKKQVVVTMKMKGLTDVLAVVEDAKKDEAWLKRDYEAQVFLLSSLEQSVALKVQSCETAATIWGRLREIYESTNVALVAKVFEEYYSYRKSTGDDMATHVSKVEALASHLDTVGQPQSEISIMSRLLYSLPSSYNSLKEAWESVSSENQTRSALITRLISHSSGEQENTKDVAFIVKDQTESRIAQSPRDIKKRSGKCYNCGKYGHFARDCRSKPKQDGIALIANLDNEQNEIIYIDSGASQHTIRNKHWFSSLEPWQEKLQVGNKDWVESKGRGTVTLLCKVGEKEERIMLHDALFIPEMSNNLLSTGKAAERGAVTIFKNKCCEIIYGGRVIARGWQQLRGLYALDAKAVAGSAMIVDSKRPLGQWHRALGHADPQVITEMANSACVRGMQIEKQSNDHNCSPCAAGKTTRASHTRLSSYEPAEVGDRVDLDLIGPINDESLGKKRYILLAKDKYSSYSHIYLLCNKSEVPEKLQHYTGAFESESGRRVKEIHTDNGSEFANSRVRLICDLEHIRLTFSAPYVPEQNGVAERNNRTVIETVRTILADSQLPKTLWAEAANTAVYLRNRIPKRGENVTPYEIFWGRKPFVGHLVPFGTEIHSLVTDRSVGKFDPKTEESYIVGFTERVSNYRILIKSSLTVKISCDVIFRSHSRQTGLNTKPETEGEIVVTVGGQQRSNLSQYFDELLENMSTNQIGAVSASKENECFVTAHANDTQNTISDIESPSFSNITQPSGTPVPPPRTSMNLSTPRSILKHSTPLERHPTRTPPPRLSSHQTSARRTSVAGSLEYPSLDEMAEKSPFTRVQFSRSPSQLRQISAIPESSIADVPSAQALSETPKITESRGGVITRAISKQLGKLLVVESAPSITEPATFEDATTGPNNKDWKVAIQAELDAHATNRTWTVVSRPKSGTILTTKWVFKVKRDERGWIEKFKARLVARGFQQREGRDYVEKEIYAPVAKCESIRTLLALAKVENLIIERFDVSTAFLNGKIDEEVFVEPPEGITIQPSQCLKLEKALYGLKQAPKAWNSTFDRAAIDLGFSRLVSDACVYFHPGIPLYMSIYVDDGLILGKTREACLEVIRRLNKCFATNRVGGEIFLGIQMRNSADGLHLSQRRYIDDLLRRFNMSECSGFDSPLVDTKILFEEHGDTRTDVPYRSAIGGLLYVALCTRPDILYPTILLSRFNQEPLTRHWAAVKRVMGYLKRTSSLGLYFKSSGQGLTLDVYSDADWAGDEDTRRSTSGVLILLSGSPIVFVSRQQSTVAQSSTEAELIAANEAVKELMWLISFLNELNVVFEKPTLFVDNKSAIALIRNNDVRRRSKHVDVKYHLIREKLGEGLFNLEYVNTKEQLADFLTKPLGSNQLQNLLKSSNLISFYDAGIEGECYDANNSIISQAADRGPHGTNIGIRGSDPRPAAMRSVPSCIKTHVLTE